MNISNQSIVSTLDEDDDQDFSHQLAIIQGAIYIPIFCAGIVNNLLTILIMILNRDMHTVTNCYLLNLAISDTLPLIVSLPFEIAVGVFRGNPSSFNFVFDRSSYQSNSHGDH